MSKVKDIGIAILGNRNRGNPFVVFNRLSWWLTKRGHREMERLSEDPLWDEPTLVAFDGEGNPLALPGKAEADLLEMLADSEMPVPLQEAESLVEDTLDADLTGEPMAFDNRWEKARVDLLRLMYDDRLRAAPPSEIREEKLDLTMH